MEQLKMYVKESYNELVNKVTWPTGEKLMSFTITVLVSSLILALLIFIMDAGFQSVMKLIYNV